MCSTLHFLSATLNEILFACKEFTPVTGIHEDETRVAHEGLFSPSIGCHVAKENKLIALPCRPHCLNEAIHVRNHEITIEKCRTLACDVYKLLVAPPLFLSVHCTHLVSVEACKSLPGLFRHYLVTGRFITAEDSSSASSACRWAGLDTHFSTFRGMSL